MIYYEVWLTILVGLHVIWRLLNERVWRNSKTFPVTTIRTIAVSVSHYINAFSCNSAPSDGNINFMDVSTFITSSGSNEVITYKRRILVSLFAALCFCPHFFNIKEKKISKDELVPSILLGQKRETNNFLQTERV